MKLIHLVPHHVQALAAPPEQRTLNHLKLIEAALKQFWLFFDQPKRVLHEAAK